MLIKLSRAPFLAAITAGLLLGSDLAWPAAGADRSVHPEIWPAAAPAALDPAVESFVQRVLSGMTLEEKVGQMIQADIASISPAELRTYKLGSILAGGGAAPGNNVRTTPQAWLDLTDEYYRASQAASGAAHPPIPILFGIDAVHGHAKIMGATIFPHNIGLGAAHDPQLIRRIGAATAEEVAATGIDWTFAPTVAVARDVRWGRSYESYSESPELVAEYAAAMVTGLQGRARHAAIHVARAYAVVGQTFSWATGAPWADGTRAIPSFPRRSLAPCMRAGYPAAIKAGAMIVMASYNSWNGVKLHADRYLLTDILKGRLGFDGFVVGDWNAHEEIPGCTKYRCAAAILAGVDMLMAPDSWRELYDNTLAQARSGEIPQPRIDDAVRRILRVKTTAGLFQRPAPKQRSDAGDFARLGSAAHRALAREAVRKSLVLLKNDHDTLPLNPRAKILVAGDAADSIGAQSGGWTIDWQGDQQQQRRLSRSHLDLRRHSSGRAGGRRLGRPGPDGRYTDKPDAAIVVFGEGPYAEFEGDRENLEFSPAATCTHLEVLRRLRAAGIPTVAVFLSGRPLWVESRTQRLGCLRRGVVARQRGRGSCRSSCSVPPQPSATISPGAWPSRGR